MQQWVIVQQQCLQITKASDLWRQSIQLVVTHIHVHQVRQINKQLIWYRLYHIVTEIKNEQIFRLLQSSWDFSQLVMTQIHY